MDLLEPFLLAHGGVITAAEATGLGLTPTHLRTLVRSHVLHRVCQGGYVDARRLRGASGGDAHRLRVRAVIRTRPEHYAASHQSAAVLLALPLLTRDLDRVHVVRRSPGGSARRRDAFTVHECTETEFEQVDGVWSVTPVAAVLGAAVATGGISAQAVVDAALRAGLVDLAALQSGLERWRGVPGVQRARAAVAGADPAAESVGESGLRRVLRALGHHARSQVRIADRDGRFVARVDFLLEELGVVVEFDGAVKYEGADGRQALVAEKRREDRLRELGYGVVRVTWEMLFHPARIQTAIEAAARAARLGRPA